MMNVRVGAYDFPIRAQEEPEAAKGDTYGTFHLEDGIRVHPDLGPARMASTILHEVIHAIFRVHRLRRSRMTEEQVCTLLEAPLLCFIRDNPALVATLIAAAGGCPIRLPPAA